MPIGRPRRIFRSAFPRLLRRVATTAALALGVIGAGNWLAGLDWNSPGRAGLPERLEARAGQVAVVDGGTLRLQDRVVRLIGVAPPPRDVPGHVRLLVAAGVPGGIDPRA